MTNSIFNTRNRLISHTLLAFSAICISACSPAESPSKFLEIQVSGEGEIKAIPDLAIVNATLQLQGKESHALLLQAEKIMAQTLLALEASGIDSKNIEAGQLHLQQRWIYTNGKRSPDGYDIQRPLSITLEDIRLYPPLIDTLSQNGINTFGGISFDYSERQTLMDQATAKAVLNAKHKAQVMAEALSKSQCQASQISLGGAHMPVVHLEMAKMSVASSNDRSYNPGEQSLSVQISASFACQ